MQRDWIPDEPRLENRKAPRGAIGRLADFAVRAACKGVALSGTLTHSSADFCAVPDRGSLGRDDLSGGSGGISVRSIWNKLVSSAIAAPFSSASANDRSPSISNIAPFSPTAMPTRLWRNGCMRALSASLCAGFRAARPRSGRSRSQLRPIFRDREDFSAGGSLNDQIHRRARRFRRADRALLARLGEKPLRERGNPALQASPPGAGRSCP